MRASLKILISLFILQSWAFAGSHQPSEARVAAGIITRVKGNVGIEVNRARRKAVENERFYLNDTFVTGPDGRVKLQFAEGGPQGKNEVVLSGNTRFVILRAGSEAAKTNGTELHLRQGTVRSHVRRKYSGEGGDVFQIRSPNSVAGVRGTIFLMSFDPRTNLTSIFTQRGSVDFKTFETFPMNLVEDRAKVKGNQSQDKKEKQNNFKSVSVDEGKMASFQSGFQKNVEVFDSKTEKIPDSLQQLLDYEREDDTSANSNSSPTDSLPGAPKLDAGKMSTPPPPPPIVETKKLDPKTIGRPPMPPVNPILPKNPGDYQLPKGTEPGKFPPPPPLPPPGGSTTTPTAPPPTGGSTTTPTAPVPAPPPATGTVTSPSGSTNYSPGS